MTCIRRYVAGWVLSLLVLLTSDASGEPPARTTRVDGGWVVRANSRKRACEAVVLEKEQGCVVGPEVVATFSDGGMGVDDAMGTEFIECGAKAVICEIEFSCRCRPKSNKPSK